MRSPATPAIRGAVRPALPLPGPTGCYPYREPLPAPPPGGPPPGPPALSPPGLASTPEPTPNPVYVPAPGEVPPLAAAGAGEPVSRRRQRSGWQHRSRRAVGRRSDRAAADDGHRSTAPMSSPISRTATASSSATTCASSASRSARSTRSSRSRSGSRSPSGTTTSTRCLPTPRP